MKKDIATANDLTRGQESAVLLKIAEQTGIQDVTEAAKFFLRGSFELVRVKILDIIDTTITSATTEKFVAKDKFRKDSKEIKFWGFGSNFENWFLAGDGKTEEPLDVQELRYGNLTKNSVDGPIIDELGGDAKAETTLTELHDLLKKQGNGEGGDLLTNGCANIFYIRDYNGVLRAVSVYWGGCGWLVGAGSVEGPHGWYAGRRFFSRNS